MNPWILFTAFTSMGVLFVGAQNVKEEPLADPIQDAIEAFANRDKKPNEVVVVLSPPVAEKPVETPASTPAPAGSNPVRVTGSFPAENQVVPPSQPTASAHADVQPTPPPPKPAPELTVRVEKLQTGKGRIDPSEVTLRTPYPAKPLSEPPNGWRLDISESAPPFTREVEISPGSMITLTISPHILIPDADGENVFAIPEPGYDNSIGYEQNATFGSILSNASRQLDEDSKKIGAALERLEQLLVSLPKPAPPPAATTVPASMPKPATTRKK